jgi:hypothetical protein
VKNTGRRIQWGSRIEVEAEAGKTVPQSPAIEGSTLKASPLVSAWVKPVQGVATTNRLADWLISSGPTIAGPAGAQSTPYVEALNPGSIYSGTCVSASTITTHKGVDIYEVLWTADVTTDRELRRPSIDEIRHLELRWEPVT